MRSLYRLEVQANTLKVFMDTAALGLDTQQFLSLGHAVRDLTARVQARAVRNVSGYPVQYDGRVFRVRVQTGALKGAIDMEWPYQSILQGRVFVNSAHTVAEFQIGDGFVRPRPVGDYAAAIEFGHEAIDLKQFMMGKTVPFFAARSQGATGPYAATGLMLHAPGDPEGSTGEGSWWRSDDLNKKLAAKGKRPMFFQKKNAKSGYAKGGAGAYYISFRKVGKTGWVIPAARARPFMRAAGTGPATQQDARRIIGGQLREVLRDSATRH